MKNKISIEKTDCIAIYLKDINRFPLLSSEEEKECVAMAEKGDKKAREKLVNSNLRFVVKIAKKYRNSGLSFLDLISEGNIGLMIAAQRFDSSKGVKFISYAVWWIKQTILKAISEKSRLIHIPVNRLNELSRIEEEMEKSGQDVESLAFDMNIDRTTLTAMMNVSKSLRSFDEPVGDGDTILGDVVKDEAALSPEDEALHSVLKDEIKKMLSVLSTRESAILKYRFGLEGEEPHSLVEVGMAFNLTKERIRQIEKKSLEKLRSAAISQGLDTYVA